MQSTVTIEPITVGRFEGYHRTLDLVAKEKKYLGGTSAPPVQRSLAFVEENIRVGNPHLVVVNDGEVIGWCDICRIKDSIRGELGMGLLPDHRERGIGLALLTKAIEAAHNTGITEVVLTVHTDNVRAIALYKKIGFMEVAGSIHSVLLDGNPKKAINMLHIR